MSLPLVILGTGGSVYDVLDIVESTNAVAPSWELVGFLDDARPAGTRHLDLEILGPLDEADLIHHGHTFVNAIGSDRTFRRLPKILASTGLTADQFATLVHPGASVSTRALLGRGVTINYGVSVGGGAKIGNHVVLCPGCTIGHNATIDDYTIVAPGAVISGFVHVGRSCYIGASAVIRQHLRLGDGSLIGMGAVVIRDTAAGSIVVGNPARPLPNEDFLSLPVISEARR
jgi:sugar O-acyltransferase (sialic acid O-acetyltransferase NeuD family)